MKKIFFEKVYQATKQIPPGKVASYGQIAKIIGQPKAARAVGNALHHNPDPKTIPCHRVVNREGGLAPNFADKGWQEHKKKLLKEGVKFRDEKHVAEEYIVPRSRYDIYGSDRPSGCRG